MHAKRKRVSIIIYGLLYVLSGRLMYPIVMVVVVCSGKDDYEYDNDNDLGNANKV